MLLRFHKVVRAARHPRRATWALFALLVAPALFIATGRPSSASPGAPPHAAWRVLIYMAADNDLEAAAVNSLNELRAIEGSSAVQVAAQIDRSARYFRGDGDWSGARRYRSTRGLLGGSRVEQVADLGPVDSGAVATLRAFVSWGLAAVPGERTLLILWGHGRGDRGLLVDEATGSYLRPVDVAAALDGRRIDVLGMDVCSMQTLGVAEALMSSTPYLAGSESPRHALGWRYGALLTALAEAPTMSPRDAAKWLAEHSGDRGEEYTGSALDLGRVPALRSRVDAAMTAAKALPREERAQLIAAVERLHATSAGARTVDLGAALALFAAALPDAAGPGTEQLRDPLSGAVFSAVHSAEFADTTGLAVRRAQILDGLSGRDFE